MLDKSSTLEPPWPLESMIFKSGLVQRSVIKGFITVDSLGPAAPAVSASQG